MVSAAPVLPLTLADEKDYENLEQSDQVRIEGLGEAIQPGTPVMVENETQSKSVKTTHNLSPRQCEVLASGGLINWIKTKTPAG